ncbi:Ff.00g077230.m01.CDS01 [Fusarium sp. VM40]|nr:Ff.00g077230.m01.CDS01 [Fusarium sp. VM40]
MTTPPSSLKSSPRKIPSEISDTRSLASSNFAQLLSKFEVLDAVSLSNSSHASPKVKPSAIKPPSIVGQTLSRSPKRSSQVSIKIRERSSTESSQFSSVGHVPPKQKSQQLRRAQTFGAKAPITSSDNVGSKTRQMSVAERRMMFETASQGDKSLTPHTSTISRSTQKLAHSKSWQSIKTIRSAGEPHNNNAPILQELTSDDLDSPLKATPLSSPVVHSPRTPLASGEPLGTWRSPLNRPVDSWPSFKRSSLIMAPPDTSPSYTKSQYTGMSPHSVHTVTKSQVKIDAVPDDKQNVLIDESRHHGWVRNARKIASSLSNTVSAGSSSLLNRSRESQDASSQASSGTNGFMSFKFGTEGTVSRPKLPRSRIANLRKKFDQSKEQAAISTAPHEITRRESILVKTEKFKSPSKCTLLESSVSSESGPLNTQAFRSKSYAPYRSQVSFNRSLPQSPIDRRNTEKHVSPLKQKIDLFKSLDHHDTIQDSPVSTPVGKRPLLQGAQRQDSVIGPLRSFKGTLRKISTSCRRVSSEWSTTSSREIGTSILRSSDNSPVTHEDQVVGTAVKEPLSPLTLDAFPNRPILSQTFLTNEISPLALEKPLSLPRASIARAGFNIDGEAGMSGAPPPLFAEPQRRFSYTRHALSRVANRFSLPDVGKELEFIELLEDNLRNNPFVSRSRCELEQPRPVRANKVRRLVSLCKDKVRRISAGHSE